MKLVHPAPERNKEPIAAVLEECLPKEGQVLEVASGSGQHAVFFARRFPGLTWQPSDPDPAARASIAAHLEEANLPNLKPPIEIDATSPSWAVKADAIVCINMVHISPWAATIGLFTRAAEILVPGRVLFLYGPYTIEGAYNADSNRAFDASLRARNPDWGLRDLRDVEQIADGFVLERTVDMPANNYSVVFRRRGSSGQSGSTPSK